MATISLTAQESEQIFLDALCNGHHIAGYGLSMEYDEDQYREAKNRLIASGMDSCLEDIWMEILRGGGHLTLVDEECDGEYTSTITLSDVHERIILVPFKHLVDAVNEDGDGDTADVILQTIFFSEVVFG